MGAVRVATLLLCGVFTCLHSTEFYFECLETRVDFNTAQKMCEDGGRKLATIRNEQEQNALTVLLKTEECSVRANWTWRHAWLNYNDRQWLDGYPMLYYNWSGDSLPSKCVKFAVKGWIERKCGSKAATILLCENRDDEDRGDYKVLLKQTTIMQSIASLPGTNGISATFFVPSTAVVTLEIFDGEITVYLYNLREAEESQLIERKLIATTKNTKIVNVSSGDFTTYPPISADLEYIIFFIADSDCTLYNVNVFDTQNETAEPTINWGNKNWFIMGPYLYFAHTQSDGIGSAETPVCKEGTYLDTSSVPSQCTSCPIGHYQNLRNSTSCKVCPRKFSGTEKGQTFCSCKSSECNFEEESTRGPTEEKNEPEEEITIKKLITTRKPTTKHPTEKPTTKQVTTKQPTTKQPITPPPKQTSNQSNLTTPVSTPLFPGEGSSTESIKIPECSFEEVNDRIYGIFEWSGVEAGQIGTSKCFYNTSGEIFYAKRKCSSNDESQASWEAPDYTACATEKDLQILQMTSVQVTEENAVEYTENLKEMTNNMDDISSSGVESTVAALEEIENHLTPENTQSFVDISSNLLDASEDKLSNSKASLKNLMTTMAKSIADSDTEQTIVTKNVDIVTTKLDPGKPATMASNDTSIDIPKTLTSQTSGAYLVVYKTAKLFKPVGKDEKITVISDLHFSGIEVTDAEEEIKLAFEELQAWTVNDSQVIQCVFWNGSFWDDYGCRYDSAVKACFCNHATPFTSILSFKKTDSSEEPVNPVVWWIEVVCFSASIISCIAFITIILSIKGLRRLQSFKMHCNLAVALLLQYIGYLVLDIVDLEGNECKAIGFLVHWITLACFFAMFAEALSVYLAIVIVFDSHVSHIVTKVALFCWGVTGSLVGLFAGITKMKYYSCTSSGYLAPPYSLYFQTIPVFSILMINSAMFGMVVWHTLKNKMTRPKDGSTAAQVISQLKMAFSLNTMLGVGYLLALITEFSTILEIIFIVINGLAGLFLLCLFGIFNPMTKAAIKKSVRKFHPVNSTKSTYAYRLTKTSNRQSL